MSIIERWMMDYEIEKRLPVFREITEKLKNSQLKPDADSFVPERKNSKLNPNAILFAPRINDPIDRKC